jgi:hypothetical protein
MTEVSDSHASWTCLNCSGETHKPRKHGYKQVRNTWAADKDDKEEKQDAHNDDHDDQEEQNGREGSGRTKLAMVTGRRCNTLQIQ